MLMEPPGGGIFRVDGKGADAGDVGRLQCAPHGILQQAGTELAALPRNAHGQAGQQHDRHRMAGQALGQPLRCVGIGDVADDQGVEANDIGPVQPELGLRRARLLIDERVADQEAVRLGAAAGETVNGMIAAEFLDPKSIRHPGSATSKADAS